MKKSISRIFSSALIILLLQSNLVHAESTPEFTYNFTSTANTDGGHWKFILKPGETIQDAFIVKNLDLERSIELTPQAGEKGTFPLNPIWFNLPTTINLAPLESKIVPFSVTIPENTIPQKYTGTLKVILTNYFGLTGEGTQVFVALGKIVSVEVTSASSPILPPTTLNGKSYKQSSNNKTGAFIDWEDIVQLGTDFDKYNIKFKKGYYENFTSEKTANSYISYGSYYNLVGLEPGYIWTFQIVPVKKVDGLYVEVGEKSNMIHCKISDKTVSEAYVCSYLSPSEAAAIGVTP